jgi:hypothetical protein
MPRDPDAAYDDGRIRLDDESVVIRRYYPWGEKRIPYGNLKGVTDLPLSGVNAVRRWRIWGTGDFVHWWNLDPQRPRKRRALVLDVGRRVRPTITPDQPDRVESILRSRLGSGF